MRGGGIGGKHRTGFSRKAPMLGAAAAIALISGGSAATVALGTGAAYALQRYMQKSRKVLDRALPGTKFYLRGTKTFSGIEKGIEQGSLSPEVGSIRVEEAGSLYGGHGVTIGGGDTAGDTVTRQCYSVFSQINEKLKATLLTLGDFDAMYSNDNPRVLYYSVFLKTGTPEIGEGVSHMLGAVFHPEICISTKGIDLKHDSICIDDASLFEKKYGENLQDHLVPRDRGSGKNRLTNGFVFLGYFKTSKLPRVPDDDENIAIALALVKKIAQTNLSAVLVNQYNGYLIPGLRGKWGNDEYDYKGETHDYCAGLEDIADTEELYGEKLTNGKTIEQLLENIEYSLLKFNCQHVCELMLSVLRCWPPGGKEIGVAGSGVIASFTPFTDSDGQTNMNLDLHQAPKVPGLHVKMEKAEPEEVIGDLDELFGIGEVEDDEDDVEEVPYII